MIIFTIYVDNHDQRFLLPAKDEALDVFKVFKVEIDNQYGKHIKIMKSNRDGEY